MSITTLPIDSMRENQEEIITRKVWANNGKQATMLISLPFELADKHGMKIGSTLLVIDKPDGILFKKLEVK